MYNVICYTYGVQHSKYILNVPNNDYKKHIIIFYKELSNAHLNHCIKCNVLMQIPKRKWDGNNLTVVWACGVIFKLVDPVSKYIRPSKKYTIRV